jgi:hypothetical protein
LDSSDPIHRDGVLPPFQEGEVDDGWKGELLKASHDLTVGGLSEIIETSEGLCRARMIERTSARQTTINEARETIRRELLREAEQSTRENFAKSLEKRHPATRNQALIKGIPDSIAKPESGTPTPEPP